MMIPLSIAEKLHLLASGEQMPASSVKHAIIIELIAENIISERLSGRTRRTLYIADRAAFSNYLYNKWAIEDLGAYIAAIKNPDSSRSDLVQVSSNSKSATRRTFKGFLVNSYMPVPCTLNGAPFVVHPVDGTFQFVFDYEQFIPAPEVVIVGVENAECFRQIAKLKHLFADRPVLFVSRYPQEQGKDVIRWLQSIPNKYLHLGDYDFAGINIYLQEYKCHLNERASFFIPEYIEELIEKYGNRQLYDRQPLNNNAIEEEALNRLVSLIHKHKKGLEQEALLIR